MAKRVPWRHVKAKALTVHSQGLYERYVEAFESANELGWQLREAVGFEWSNRYPDGVDGQICIFSATEGALMYVMKDKSKQKGREKKAFDADRGDDVFSHASAELTDDLAKVNEGTDESDTLAIISERLKHALSESPETEEQKSVSPRRTGGPSFSERLRGQG